MDNALSSLTALALSVGVATADLPKAPAPARVETIEGSVSLTEARAAAERAGLPRTFPGAELSAAAGFDAQAELWVKLRSGSWRAAEKAAGLTGEKVLATPLGPASVSYRAKTLSVSAAGSTASWTESELMDALYAAALKAPFGPIPYAVLHEDGSSGAPAALCLLRRGSDGDYFVTYRTLAQMRTTQWVMAADGVLHGMRISGDRLLLVSKPVPPVK